PFRSDAVARTYRETACQGDVDHRAVERQWRCGPSLWQSAGSYLRPLGDRAIGEGEYHSRRAVRASRRQKRPDPSAASVIVRARTPSTGGVKGAGQPKHYQNNQHEAQDAAKPRCPVSAVSVVSATPAEQQDQHDYDEDCTHSAPL